MLTARVAIVGGGLSGLYAAALLEARGIRDYVVFEAKTTLGGRILSLPATPPTDLAPPQTTSGRYDLGATWFWPSMQPELSDLVKELGLKTVEQHETGGLLTERSRNDAPDVSNGYLSAPKALRLVDGMAALIDSLLGRVNRDRILTGRRVTQLRHHETYVEVHVEDTQQGDVVSYRAAQILLAIPPRLAASTIAYTPALPDALARQWLACGTWMAPHAKYLAVFDKPFWRDQGLSGEARSSVGPMVEIHDASTPDGRGALFGFLGVPARIRRQVPEEMLLSHCRAQLSRLFGDRAATPELEYLKDWANDPYTATSADEAPDSHYLASLSPAAAAGAWRDRLIAVGSEWSPQFSGYVAGAVDAARRGVHTLLNADVTHASVY